MGSFNLKKLTMSADCCRGWANSGRCDHGRCCSSPGALPHTVGIPDQSQNFAHLPPLSPLPTTHLLPACHAPFAQSLDFSILPIPAALKPKWQNFYEWWFPSKGQLIWHVHSADPAELHFGKECSDFNPCTLLLARHTMLFASSNSPFGS